MSRKKSCTILLALLMPALLCAGPCSAEGPTAPIKIGAIFSLSSFGGSWGSAERQATELAVEDINRAGGVLGRKLELVVEDNGSDLKKTVSAFHKLAGVDHVAAILGPNWVEFAEVAAPLANQAQLVTISASGYKESIFKNNSFFFSSWPPHDQTLSRFAAFLARQGHKKLALLTANNAYYQEISDALERQLQANKSPVALRLFFNPDERDFRSTILNLKKNGCDAVMLALMLDGSLTAFLQQARDLGYQGSLYADNDFVLDSILKSKPAIGEGVTFFNWSAAPEAPFTKRFKERFGVMPVVSSVTAYDNALALKRALEICGAHAGSRLRECMLQVEFQGEAGMVAFASNGKIKASDMNARIYKSIKGQIVEQF